MGILTLADSLGLKRLSFIDRRQHLCRVKKRYMSMTRSTGVCD